MVVMRARIGVVALILLGIVSGCGGGTPPRPSADLLLGSWRSEEYSTQLGTATETICFKADHTVEIAARTQAGELDNHGTYRREGSTLTYSWPTGATAEAHIQTLNPKDLVLVSESGKALRYRRTREKC